MQTLKSFSLVLGGLIVASVATGCCNRCCQQGCGYTPTSNGGYGGGTYSAPAGAPLQGSYIINPTTQTAGLPAGTVVNGAVVNGGVVSQTGYTSTAALPLESLSTY